MRIDQNEYSDINGLPSAERGCSGFSQANSNGFQSQVWKYQDSKTKESFSKFEEMKKLMR